MNLNNPNFRDDSTTNFPASQASRNTVVGVDRQQLRSNFSQKPKLHQLFGTLTNGQYGPQFCQSGEDLPPQLQYRLTMPPFLYDKSNQESFLNHVEKRNFADTGSVQKSNHNSPLMSISSVSGPVKQSQIPNQLQIALNETHLKKDQVFLNSHWKIPNQENTNDMLGKNINSPAGQRQVAQPNGYGQFFHLQQDQHRGDQGQQRSALAGGGGGATCHHQRNHVGNETPLGREINRTQQEKNAFRGIQRSLTQTPQTDDRGTLNKLKYTQFDQHQGVLMNSAQKAHIEKMTPFKQDKQVSNQKSGTYCQFVNKQQQNPSTKMTPQHISDRANHLNSMLIQKAGEIQSAKGPVAAQNNNIQNNQFQKRSTNVQINEQINQSKQIPQQIHNTQSRKIRVVKFGERGEQLSGGGGVQANNVKAPYQPNAGNQQQQQRYSASAGRQKQQNAQKTTINQTPQTVISPLQTISQVGAAGVLEGDGGSKSTLPHIPYTQEEASPYLDHVKSGSQQETGRQQQDPQGHLPLMRSASSLGSQTRGLLEAATENPFQQPKSTLQATVVVRQLNQSASSKQSIDSEFSKTEEQRKIDRIRNSMYTKFKSGDTVTYESRCKVRTFNEENSMLITDCQLYASLDQKCLQISNEAQQPADFTRFCNELGWVLKDGNVCDTPPNDELFMLHSPIKNLYDVNLAKTDQEKLRQLKAEYWRFKKVTELPRTLVIPPAKAKKGYVRFYARFECGNLLRAVKVPVKPDLTFSGIPNQNANHIHSEYDLYLQTDSCTDGHMHWFYFQTITRNLQPGQRIRINIRNLVRGKSLYQDGMLPRICFQDQTIRDKHHQGWHVDPTITEDLRFYPTEQSQNFDVEFFNKERNFSTLSFVYVIQSENESVSFAYDQPYTYSTDLRAYLDSLRYNPAYSRILQIQTLCRSLADNECRFLTITENIEHVMTFQELLEMFMHKDSRERTYVKMQVGRLDVQARMDKIKQVASNMLRRSQQKVMKGDQANDSEVGIITRYHDYFLVNHHKKAIIITARVHPGETQASFALEGIVNFLLSDCDEAKELRQNFIIYVVPMLNIDGVVHGNHRTNLPGFDLNRKWAEPSPYLSPIIYAVKNLAKMIQEEREIVIFCDIHGHFQPSGSFMYCNSYDRGTGVAPTKYHNNAGLRVIPYLLTQQNKYFQIRDSLFTMEQYKAAAARQVFFTEFRVDNSFTLECSFFKKYGDREIEILNNLHLTNGQKNLQIANLSSVQNNPQRKTEENRASIKVQKTLSQLSTHSRNIEDSPSDGLRLGNSNFRSASKAEQTNQSRTFADGALQQTPQKDGRFTRIGPQPLSRAPSSMQPNRPASEDAVLRMSFAQQSNKFTKSSAGLQYDTVNFCHHFTGDDHRELGKDLGIVFHKVLIDTQENQDKVSSVQQRYMSYLHGKQLQVSIAQKVNLNNQISFASATPSKRNAVQGACLTTAPPNGNNQTGSPFKAGNAINSSQQNKNSPTKKDHIVGNQINPVWNSGVISGRGATTIPKDPLSLSPVLSQKRNNQRQQQDSNSNFKQQKNASGKQTSPYKVRKNKHSLQSKS